MVTQAPKHSKFELIQNCSSHLPCTHFRGSGSFYYLIWTKWTNTRQANARQTNARDTSFAQAGWTHLSCKCRGNCPTVMLFNSSWMDEREALSSWSRGTAVPVSAAARDGPWEELWPCRDCLNQSLVGSLSQGFPGGSLGHPGTPSGGCWPRAG